MTIAEFPYWASFEVVKKMLVIVIICLLLSPALVLCIAGLACFKLYLLWIYPNCRSRAKLNGKTVIVTGANSGIGKETALDLAKRGARVICACRNEQLGKEAVRAIKEYCCHENVVFERLDLADFDSIKDFAERIKAKENRLDILINNAGLAWQEPHATTKQGHEMTIGVNHFGHFLLTHWLLDLLKTSAPSRIVIVSSYAHKLVKLNNWQNNGLLQELAGYNASKLANVIHARQLARKLEGTGVTVNSLHPGLIATDSWRSIKSMNPFLARLCQLIIKYVFIDCKTGAQTSIHCAVEESLETISGQYFSRCKVAKESDLARDEKLGKRLWDLSIKACGLKDY